MDPLYRELHRWMALPFDWSTMNCCFAVADWIEIVRGVDPAATDRWTFDDLGSCQRATGYFTDPVGVAQKRLEAIGIQRGNELRAGDVGLLKLPDVGYPVAGVFTGTSWAFKGPDGTTTRQPQMVELMAFWSIGYDPE